MPKSDIKEMAGEIELLVKSAQEGNVDDFAKLYDLFVEPIYRYVFFRVNSTDAEDLVENVFVKVWENLKSYKQKEGRSFSAWVFRIAHNVVVDYYRANSEKETLELDPQLPDLERRHNPIRNTEASLDKATLKKAISGLKKQYQEIIIYKFISDLSNQEIADILKKSEGSLRILQFRALKALKKELANMGFSVT